jgi:hypothetical protein
MTARCPHCGKEVTLDDERRGRPVRCPECDQGFRAPLQDMEEGFAPVAVSSADKIMLAMAVLCGLGLLLVLAAMLAHQQGYEIPTSRELLVIMLIVPFASIGVSWWGLRRTRRVWLVWVSRLLAYVLILAMVLLWRMVL